MRAAIYARYSSNLQSNASIEGQIRVCKQRIEKEGWTLTEIYSDHAISGASVLRPGYQKMREDARNGAFDILVAEALDRLSRDQEDIAGLYKQLSFASVRLITLAEGEVNELHVGLKGTMNALFLKDLAQKTHRGLEGRVRQGRSAGGNTYGYDVMHETGPDGMPSRGGRRINGRQAEVVRRIFQDYADGKSPRRIAHDLNAEDVPGPRSKAWGPSTINGNVKRGTGVLNNELYIGRFVWNRLRYVKDPDTGKRISRLNSEDEWIVKEVPDLRIVDQELWDRVKGRQKALRRNTRPDCWEDSPYWDRRRPRYLFSGLVKCGCCGGGFVVISKYLYGCATARNKGTCDNRLNIRRDVLEASVLNGLKSHLMEPELFKEFADEFYREINRLRGAEVARLEGSRAELVTVERKIRKIVDAITDGVSARSLKDELLALEARQEKLKTLLADSNAPEPLVHPNLAEVYRRKVANLNESLQQEDTKAEAAEIIRNLVDEIVLVPENGHLRIDLKGELAGILSFASGKKKPATHVGDGLEQIKMVAGAGFVQDPTMLKLRKAV